jgi:formylglycine-generating enzyme required for sulfatase activity
MTATAGSRLTPSPRSLARRLFLARAETDGLFDLIDSATLYERPIPDRHRLIFYLGHLEAFDWNLIGRGVLELPSFHPTFDHLFAFGIDPEPGAAPSDTPGDWPSVEEVRAYNAETRKRIDGVLQQVPYRDIQIAVEHRLMHAETFAYLLHNLSHEKKRFVAQQIIAAPAPDSAFVQIPAGRATLGQREDEFGWDNEFAEHTVQVPAFRISRYKVTNGEYLKLVEDGASPPHFWIREQRQWFLRGMFENMPLPLDWPVFVTHAEASAYARWAGADLPAEAQFHRAAYGRPDGAEQSYPWGDADPAEVDGNFNFRRWDPAPVTASPGSDSAFGVAQLAGNGWEWTSSVFEPFAGFEPYPLYAGYSQPFFDGKHFVLKGGSPRTAACFLRRSFRNWFRPEYPYVYASFRLVQNG